MSAFKNLNFLQKKNDTQLIIIKHSVIITKISNKNDTEQRGKKKKSERKQVL